ncbi:aminotransferase class I/II-fold pyridoxal phosphate-dependent enzyme [Allokutzneria sp. A3M-2-11 16]|uniref:trans-sulfuration enzyme family protein n=1 Tax=Allokutzneria sp. A3M-2-11 16 TaxID=2962043 RepID=UPI0020B7E68E|nr:aminotransferase class I/II-fold pyridoxal phosphate-dependent enzyme [Allokutzneria sp. A3M-2-11 16]MCP3802670.1 aminotransferase class I/II-fold pyridoxal phosphate-dependent enzyme [Allokutzneria sp. A3M-2-11 16]
MGSSRYDADHDAVDPSTRAVHIRAPHLEGVRPLSLPIFQTSSFAFTDSESLADSLAGPDGSFAYSRYGNPTTRALERAVADLEGGVAAVATASGMGAISSVLLARLRSGDHVVVQSALYGGTVSVLRDISERFGVEVSYFSGAASELTEALRPNTRLLYLETIANPTTRVNDLPALARIGRDAGLTVVVDNTFASPLLCRPLEHGAHIVLHSSTKFLGGHSDIIGGVVVFAEEEHHRETWHQVVDYGASADPFAAWLTARGLQTLPLRQAKQCANARVLAERLVEHPAIGAVRWPGLASHPDHETATKLLGDFGSLVSFDIAEGHEGAVRFLERIRIATLAVSLGGVETLVVQPSSSTHRQLDAAGLAAAGITEGTIRMSVGIEHAEDLWADLANALG